MPTEDRVRRGTRPSVSDDELRAMLAKGMTGSEIARSIGRTPQGVNSRLARIRKQDLDKVQYLLPWAVREEHAQRGSYVHRAVIAYAHRQRGEALTPRQRTELTELEQFLHEHDAVVTYDYNQGFMLRNRRPEDGTRLVV